MGDYDIQVSIVGSVLVSLSPLLIFIFPSDLWSYILLHPGRVILIKIAVSESKAEIKSLKYVTLEWIWSPWINITNLLLFINFS